MKNLIASRILIQLTAKRYHSTFNVAEIQTKQITNVTATVKGWARSVRSMKDLLFVDLIDGSHYKHLQLAIPKNIHDRLSVGSSIEASGLLSRSPTGQIELKTTQVKIIGHGNPRDWPFKSRNYEPEHLREFLHLRPRKTSCNSVLRMRNFATHGIHNFFQKENFMCIHTPVLTTNDCEGAGEIFQVVPQSKETIGEMKKEGMSDFEAFFDRNTYLTVSGQLHLEVAARALCNVYQFGPVFRSENSKSRLHLSEFYMVEAEIAFMNSLKELCDFIEKFMKSIIQDFVDKHKKEIFAYREILSLPRLNWENLIDKPYKRMTYDDAYFLLKQHEQKFETPVDACKHLTKEHENFLVENNNNIPIFIIEWPAEKKPFYAKICPPDSKASAVDLLFPEVGELCSGSLREDDYNTLELRLKENGLIEKLDWYLDLRKFGNIPTGGFGLGFERYLKVLFGTSSIKDTIPFPRWPHNCQL